MWIAVTIETQIQITINLKFWRSHFIFSSIAATPLEYVVTVIVNTLKMETKGSRRGEQTPYRDNLLATKLVNPHGWLEMFITMVSYPGWVTCWNKEKIIILLPLKLCILFILLAITANFSSRCEKVGLVDCSGKAGAFHDFE